MFVPPHPLCWRSRSTGSPLRSLLLAAVLAALSSPAFAESDPNRWLETTDDPAVMDWVATQDAHAIEVLQGDPRFVKMQAAALAVLSGKGRIADPEFVGPAVFNFWQDETHVRGIWRRASLPSYRRGDPGWETVLDIDALAKAENANWVWAGATCRAPAHDRCLIELSDGGEDATEVREFDLQTRRFVDGGFRLPSGKQTVQWLDPDTLILSRDWGEGTTTESGYGFVVKTLTRGQPLDEAKEVFRGQPDDVSAYPLSFADGTGRRAAVIVRSRDFFNLEFYRVTPTGAERIAAPSRAKVEGLVAGRLIFQTQQDWTPEGQTLIPSGSLVALPLDGGPVETVFAPDGRMALDPDEIATTANRVVAALYDNVRGRIASFAPGAAGWTRTDLPAPDNASAAISSAGGCRRPPVLRGRGVSDAALADAGRRRDRRDADGQGANARLQDP